MTLLAVGAIGLALVAVGVGTASGWSLIVPGMIALSISLAAVWRILAKRDRTLR